MKMCVDWSATSLLHSGITNGGRLSSISSILVGALMDRS